VSSELLIRPEDRQDARELGISLIKGAIGAIPFAGTAINEVLFEQRSRLKQQRLNDFFSDVAGDVGQLKQTAIDQRFIRSEEFSDLLEDILTRVAKTRSEEKRAHFRRVLVGAMEGRNDPDFAPHFLDLLTKLTDVELEILRRLGAGLSRYSGDDDDVRSITADRIDYQAWGLAKEATTLAVQALVSKGLLADESHRRANVHAFGVVILSDLGWQFLKWLEAVPYQQREGAAR
jgi:hypothetical protein